MWFTSLKIASAHYPKSLLATIGLIWLFIESYTGITGADIELPYWQFFSLSLFGGLIWLLVDGYLISGFLRLSIEVKSNGFDTKIIVKFGDIFSQEGWKAVAVNDFFDSIVDDNHVSTSSLHGILLQKYWGGNINGWDKQIDNDLQQSQYEIIERTSGKSKRYMIGTTAKAQKDSQWFLCVALTTTDIATLEVKATSTSLNEAVRGLLRKARSVCGDRPLSIPLMGSGLSRVGIKNNILVDLILTAIFEETKNNKVTSEIRIVLPKEKASEINLSSLQKDWS